MITRWETIADRVADRLKLPKEVVREALTDMAQKTIDHAKHPTVMETDIFGIGCIQARYGKMLTRVPHLQTKIFYRNQYAERYEKEGTDVATIKAGELRDEVAEMGRDIERIQGLIDQKKDIKDAGGRKGYIETELVGYTVEVKKKTIISDEMCGPMTKLRSESGKGLKVRKRRAPAKLTLSGKMVKRRPTNKLRRYLKRRQAVFFLRPILDRLDTVGFTTEQAAQLKEVFVDCHYLLYEKGFLISRTREILGDSYQTTDLKAYRKLCNEVLDKDSRLIIRDVSEFYK